MKKLSKTEAGKKITLFFSDISKKSPKEIKKIKKLAMSESIPLRELRKTFCKKCSNPYSGKEKVRIKNTQKIITCEKCGKINRWKLN